MASCCVKDCDSKRKNGTGVILFSLPENLSYTWKSVINRPDWEPRPYSKICNIHFSKSDYCTVAKRLEPGATPLKNKNEPQVIISSGNYYFKVAFAHTSYQTIQNMFMEETCFLEDIFSSIHLYTYIHTYWFYSFQLKTFKNIIYYRYHMYKSN